MIGSNSSKRWDNSKGHRSLTHEREKLDRNLTESFFLLLERMFVLRDCLVVRLAFVVLNDSRGRAP